MTAMTKENGWLAAEYALGVLRGAELQVAREKYTSEPVFRADVDAWHEQLAPLQDDLVPVPPPESVWRNIEQRVFDSREPEAPALLQSLAFWRGLSAFAGGLTVVVLVALLTLQQGLQRVPEPAAEALIASLNSAEGKAAFIASLEPGSHELRVRRLSAASHPSDKVPELWVIPADGVPRSLGVLVGPAAERIVLDPTIEKLFQDGVALAVSLEPPGGSPTGAPTGPVPWSGALHML